MENKTTMRIIQVTNYRRCSRDALCISKKRETEFLSIVTQNIMKTNYHKVKIENTMENRMYS